MNREASSSQSDDTMIFGMKVKVAQNQRQTKTYLSVGLVCMLLSLCFYVVGAHYQGELASQMATRSGRMAASLEMQAWVRTCSTCSFICIWLAVMTLFQVAFQHRKTLKSL